MHINIYRCLQKLALESYHEYIFMELWTGVSEQEQGITSGILDTVKAHGKSLETFQDDHSSQATSIRQRAEETFQQRYLVCYAAFDLFREWDSIN